jgi:uroporphyrinogen-III decarboxylase
MLTSRERIQKALNHEEPDRIPLDLGGCGQTGMHVSTVYRLRQALGLDAPGTPIKVIEPYQMLGEIKLDLIEAVGGDVVSLGGSTTLFGYKSENWKPWTFHDGTPLLVPEAFNTEPEPDGSLLMYAGGDKSYPAAGKMPAGGWYFDSIVRQEGEIDDDKLNVEDNLEEFSVVTDDELERLARESKHLYQETDKALMFVLGGAAFGDIALVPGMMLKNPKGIRDIAEWYMSTVIRRDYIYEVFDRQSQIVLQNLPRLYEALGDRVTAIWISGTDFGGQNGPLISEHAFCDLYQPFYRRVNDWLREHTTWKRFIHCCGSIMPLIPHMIDAGFEVFNPVQTSATNMSPVDLKAKFGDRITFWGGGVDTQHTLPFGTPDEVRAQVRERMRIFGKGGGFVFNPIHNVQAGVPVENLLAMYETVREHGSYPLQ